MRTIIDVEHMSLVEIEGDKQGDLWITFGYFGDGEPFGRTYFEKEGIWALCFVTSGNDWFQQPEIWRLVETAAEIAKTASRKVIMYGSSMGAFASLAFSRDLRATHVIAASPQISIDQRIVGDFDQRWANVAETLTFERADCRDGLSSTAVVSILYDDLHTIDRRHAEILSTFPNVKTYPFSLAGHGSLHTLNRAGLLRPMLPGLAGDRPSADKAYAAARAKYKAAVRQTPDYFFAIGERYFDQGRLAQSIRWFERSLRVSPLMTPAYERLGAALAQLRLMGADSGRLHFSVAALYLEIGRADKAAQVLNDGRGVLPADAAISQLRGAVERALAFEHLRTSLREYQASIVAHPNIPDWHLGAIELAAMLGARDLVRPLFSDARKRFPTDRRFLDLQGQRTHLFDPPHAEERPQREGLVTFTALGSNCEVGLALDVALQAQPNAMSNDSQLLRFCSIPLGELLSVFRQGLHVLEQPRQWSLLYRVFELHYSGWYQRHHESVGLGVEDREAIEAAFAAHPTCEIHLDVSWHGKFWLHGLVGDLELIRDREQEAQREVYSKVIFLARRLIKLVQSRPGPVFILKVLEGEGTYSEVLELHELLEREGASDFVLGVIYERRAMAKEALVMAAESRRRLIEKGNVVLREVESMAPHATAVFVEEHTTQAVWETFFRECRDLYLDRLKEKTARADAAARPRAAGGVK